MLASQFLEAYPRELAPEAVTQQCDHPDVVRFRQHSYGYGLLAHAALRGETDRLDDQRQSLFQYEESISFLELHQRVVAPDPSGWEYRNELGFYELNEAMLSLWIPLVKGRWPNSDISEKAFTMAMNILAIQGLVNYAVREEFIKQNNGTEALYEPQNQRSVNIITGVQQEIDVAIVVMGIARKLARTNPGITVVPAPMQFENKAGKANVDLLFVDMSHQQVTGIQTKTTVNQHTVNKYDQDRVVLVDGSTDLGNVRVVRTKKGSSKEEVRPWPGIIATSRVDAIKSGSVESHMVQKGKLVPLKLLAKRLVGSLRVNPRDLEKNIEDRIMAKLRN